MNCLFYRFIIFVDQKLNYKKTIIKVIQVNIFRSYFFLTPLFILLGVTGCGSSDSSGSSNESSKSVTTPINPETPSITKTPLLDWNQQSDTYICEALKKHNELTIGTTFTPREDDKNDNALRELEKILETTYTNDLKIISREPRISTLSVEMLNCAVLTSLRSLPQVKFVDPEYALPLLPEELFGFVLSLGGDDEILPYDEFNPAFYDAQSNDLGYTEFLDQSVVATTNTVSVMKDHQIQKIYDEFEFFGSPEIGVAVLENGVVPQYMDYLSASGYYQTQGFYTPNEDGAEPDGIHPQQSDMLYITQLIKPLMHHGSTMAARVYKVAPRVTIRSVRASSFIYWYKPSQFNSVTNAILELAVDPEIRVISASQGTIIHIHKIERAIEYFNAHDKIFVVAGGSSIPLFKKFVGIGFPANLPSTISASGIKDTELTNGEYVLGTAAHGGPENDFVVEGQDASSPSTAHTAGIISLIWSVNPRLSRQEIIDIFIESSHFYQRNGKKHPQFGWGKVNAYTAYKKAISR